MKTAGGYNGRLFLDGLNFHRKCRLIILGLCMISLLMPACSSRPGVGYMSEKAIESHELELKDENWKKRCEAIEKLSEDLGGPHSRRIEQSLVAVSHDEHDEVRISAIRAFSLHPSPLFKERLLSIAHDKSDNVRWYALLSLGAYGDPEAAPVFINGLMSEDWLIREASIIGMLKIHDPAVLNDLIPFMVRSLEDPVCSVRLATLKNLPIRDTRLYWAIVDIVRKNIRKGPTILVPALNALHGYVLDDDIREEIIPLLTHTNSDIRIAALHVIQEDQRLKEEGEVAAY